MRKLALSFVSVLAISSLLVACGGDDDGNDAKVPTEAGPQFDGGDGGVIIPETGADTITTTDGGNPNCDPATVGKYCESKACQQDTDCTGVGTGKCTQGFCENPSQCGNNSCFGLGEEEDGSRWGICTCQCTPDDSSTPLINEDSCPNQSTNVCSAAIGFLVGTCSTDADCTQYGSGLTCDTTEGRCTGEASYCLQKCDPTIGTNTCDGKLACSPSGGRTFNMYFDSVCASKGCTTDDDCPVTTGVTCNNPTGDCPNNGGKCLLLDYRSSCTADTDCDTGYKCIDLGSAGSPAKYCVYGEGWCGKPGKCDVASGLCDSKPAGLFKAGAKVGDPCKGDVDCDKNQDCDMELDNTKLYKKTGQPCSDDNECCTGTCTNGTCAAGYNYCYVGNRNGYCTVRYCEYASTLTNAACPTGSECNGLYPYGGRCQKTCTIADASTCRGNANDLIGDYECRTYAAFGLTKGPVCDLGPFYPCSFWQNSGADCSNLGDSTNSTNMSCRGLDNKATTDKFSKTGWCFDDTSSGTQQRNPLPTP